MAVAQIKYSNNLNAELVLIDGNSIVFDEFVPWGPCPKCHNPVLLGSKFCSSCGSPIVFESVKGNV